jgi:4-hydroxyphenylpyruvate dioxygenase-like putative hemolysin
MRAQWIERMHTSPLHGATLCQVAIVVRDIEEKSRAWAATLGCETPKIIVTEKPEVSGIRYRGRATNARAKLAFFSLGQITIELIEPIGEPSTWREHLNQHGESIHHIAFRVEGMKEVLLKLERQSMPAIQTGDFVGGRYAYVDGQTVLGAVLELLEIDKQP